MKEIIEKVLFIIICLLFTLMSLLNILFINDFSILINILVIILFLNIILINVYGLIILIKKN